MVDKIFNAKRRHIGGTIGARDKAGMGRVEEAVRRRLPL